MRTDGTHGNSGGAASAHPPAVSGTAGHFSRTAHRFRPCQREKGALSAAGKRNTENAGGNPRHFPETSAVPEAGTGHHRRAAPVRRGTACAAGGQRRIPAQAGHVCHAHSPHTGADDLRRSGHLHSERASQRQTAGADLCRHRQAAGTCLRLHPQAAAGGLSRIHRLSHDRRSGRQRIAGGLQLCPVYPDRRICRLSGGTAPRQDETGGKGCHHAGVPCPRDRPAGEHHRHRGRRGRAQRHHSPHRKRRAVRAVPAPPAAGTCGTWQCTELLHPHDRPCHRGLPQAHADHEPHRRRLPHCRG